MANDSDDSYLGLHELVTYSGLSYRTLQRYLHHPTELLPHYSVGGRVLVRRSEFDTWVQRFRSRAARSMSELVDAMVEGK